jgi:hypothetical protein
MGTGKTQRAGSAVVNTEVQSMKTEGPGTDKAGVLGADVMVNMVLLVVEAPVTREERILLQYFFCANLSRLSNSAILAFLFFPLCL